ncbi:MAG: glycosyltransferase [Thermodesulfobacteriota bacterium]
MTIWETNLQALKARAPAGDLLPDLPAAPPRWQRVTLVPGPHPTLQVPGEKGRPVTLHSPREAWKEADVLAARAPRAPSRPLLALGLGLGYHLLRLLPRLDPEQPLVIVEQDPEIFWAALQTLDLTPLLSRPHTALVVNPDAREVVSHLRGHLHLGNGCGDPVLWGHPASLRAANGFYQEVIAAFQAPKVAPSRSYGLKKEKLRVLVVNPDYFLIPEVSQAFQQLGHEVQLILFDKRKDQGEEVLQRILKRVADFSPDLVFTINHLGFDREGLLMEALNRLRLPSVSWYVDSPAIILNLYGGPKSDLSYIFVWDPTYVPEVKALGFTKVFTLPLATDPDIFCPRPGADLKPWRTQVAFVGNSMISSVAKKLERLPSAPEFLALFQQLLKALQGQPYRRLDLLLEEEGLAEHPLIRQMQLSERTDLEAGLIWAATRDYRLRCVRQLAPFKPTIYGDPGWQKLVPAPFRLHPEVNYFHDLPAIYGATAINFNATSLQMKAAVNQRVFDVPAAGGFLLTDFKEQLAEVLEPGKESVCYHAPEEIPGLVRFYLDHPEARRRIIERARARVLQEHTYRHRIQEMLAVLRRTL